MNAHDSIINALLAALKASPALAAGRVEEEANVDIMGEGINEAISVEFVASRPSEILLSGAPVDWSTRVRISCAARHDGMTAAGRSSRALHAQVYQRLMADPTLGGVCDHIGPPQLTAEGALIGSRLGLLHADYLIQHRSNGTTLDAQP